MNEPSGNDCKSRKSWPVCRPLTTGRPGHGSLTALDAIYVTPPHIKHLCRHPIYLTRLTLSRQVLGRMFWCRKITHNSGAGAEKVSLNASVTFATPTPHFVPLYFQSAPLRFPFTCMLIKYAFSAVSLASTVLQTSRYLISLINNLVFFTQE